MNHSPKILHLTTAIGGGGLETMLRNLTKEHHSSGSFENVVVTTTAECSGHSLEGDLREVSSFHNLEVHSLKSLVFWRKLNAIIQQEKPDLIQCWHHETGLLVGLVGKIFWRIPVVWGIHSGDISEHPSLGAKAQGVFNWLCSKGSKWFASKVISCSQAALDTHADRGYARGRLQWIPNGVDAERYQPSAELRASFREDHGIPQNVPLVGLVARYHEVKNIPLFFEAAAVQMESDEDIHFVWVGGETGEADEKVKSAFEKLPDSSRFHEVPFVSDTAKVYPALDILTLTSDSEALPMVLIEAMSCGVPCVSTDVGDGARVIGECGEAVENADAESIAGAWQKWLNLSESDRSELQSRCRQRVLDGLSLAKIGRAYSRAYHQVLEGRLLRTPADSGKKKIIHVVNDLGPGGGAEFLMHRLSENLVKEGYEQVVVSLRPLYEMAVMFEELGIETHCVELKNPLHAFSAIRRLRKVLKEWQPDVMQTWLYHSALIGCLSRRLAGSDCHMFWSIHHTILKRGGGSKRATEMIHRFLSKRSHHCPDGIIYCSELGMKLHEESGYDASKSCLITNGTDTDRFQRVPEKGELWRKKLGIPEGVPVIGTAGRYNDQKDYPNMLKAVAHIQKVYPEVHFVACGREVTMSSPALANLVEECPVPENIHLLGLCSDMAGIFSSFDLFMLCLLYTSPSPRDRG